MSGIPPAATLRQGTTREGLATIDARTLTVPSARLLGTPCLVLPGNVVHVLERRDAALVALISIEGSALRSRAAALLWPELSVKAARSNLRQRLFRLRQVAGETLVLAADDLRLGDSTIVDLHGAHAEIALDCDACAGELLGEYDYGDIETLDEWVRAARETWRRSRLDALAEQASQLERDGQVVRALGYAQHIVADAPMLEHAHRRVMRLHYLRGDRSAALAAFEACRASLKDALNVAPDRETLKLAALIEAGGGLPQGAAPAPAPAILRPPRIVGGARAWHELMGACDLGHSVLVDGDAGAGKSRLLGDFVASQGLGAALFRARLGDSQLPYALLAQVIDGLVEQFGAPTHGWAATELARVSPRLGVAPSAAIDKLRFRQALDSTVEDWRAVGLRIVALDDLHYADDATLELLPRLLSPSSEAPRSRVIWLLSVRPREIPTALQTCVAELDARTLARVSIEPLDEPAVRDLIESLALDGVDAADCAPALARHSGGNPLFVLETLRALLQQHHGVLPALDAAKLPVPSTVQRLIERRLHRLDADDLRLAQVAAVAGQDFGAALAADVLGCARVEVATMWGRLQSAQVFDGSGFTHDLVREVTERSLAEPAARALHFEVGRHLESRGGEPSRVAEHWRRAQRWDAAGAAYLRAAMIAERVSQRRLEADLAEQAAQCFVAAGDHAGEFTARDRQLRAERLFEPFAAQQQRADALVKLAASPAERCAALEIQARVLLNNADNTRIVEAAGEARALAKALGDSEREFTAAAHEAWALSRLNRIAQAEALIEHYVPIARARENELGAANALADFGLALFYCDRFEEAALLFEASLRTATALGAWSLGMDALTPLGVDPPVSRRHRGCRAQL